MASDSQNEQGKLPSLKQFTPVFCTAEIDTKIIDDFLQREDERFNQTELDKESYYLVTTEEIPGEKGDPYRPVPEAKAPIQPFKSPVIGKSLDELRKICAERYSGRPFTVFTFIVLDERTARDKNTCEIVSYSFEPTSARCDFGLAAEVLINAESNTSLNEGIDPDKMRDPENPDGVIYTTETWDMKPEDWKHR